MRNFSTVRTGYSHLGMVDCAEPNKQTIAGSSLFGEMCEWALSWSKMMLLERRPGHCPLICCFGQMLDSRNLI
jgi:hypothetical protein